MRNAVMLCLLSVMVAPGCAVTWTYWNNMYTQDTSTGPRQILRNRVDDPAEFAEEVLGRRVESPVPDGDCMTKPGGPVGDSRTGLLFLEGEASVGGRIVRGLFRANPDGSGLRLLAQGSYAHPKVHSERRTIYFSAGNSRLMRMAWDEGTVEDLGVSLLPVTGSTFFDLFLDRERRWICWITKDTDVGPYHVWRVPLDQPQGATPERITPDPLCDEAGQPIRNLKFVALDARRNELFWITYDRVGATILGSGETRLIRNEPGHTYFSGLALDRARGRAYWCSVNRNSIAAANFDGSEWSEPIRKGWGITPKLETPKDPNPMYVTLLKVYPPWVPCFLRCHPD